MSVPESPRPYWSADSKLHIASRALEADRLPLKAMKRMPKTIHFLPSPYHFLTTIFFSKLFLLFGIVFWSARPLNNILNQIPANLKLKPSALIPNPLHSKRSWQNVFCGEKILNDHFAIQCQLPVRAKGT